MNKRISLNRAGDFKWKGLVYNGFRSSKDSWFRWGLKYHKERFQLKFRLLF